MPLHNWSRAREWMFPDFHSSWLTFLKVALNRGLLPPGYFAMAETRASLYTPDVQTRTDRPRPTPERNGGGVAVAGPRTETTVLSRGLPVLGRALTVRRNDGNRIVAVIEVVSPANKDRPETVGDFAGKVVSLVRGGVHVVVLDILPAGRHDPNGMHAAIWPGLDVEHEADLTPPPTDRPFPFVGYRSDSYPSAYVNFGAVGRELPEVPLFLDDGVFVSLPVEATYMTNFNELPPALRTAFD